MDHKIAPKGVRIVASRGHAIDPVIAWNEYDDCHYGAVMKLVFQIALGVLIGLAAADALKLIAGAAVITALLTPTEHAAPFPPAQILAQRVPTRLVLPTTVITQPRPKACQATRADGTIVYCDGPLTDPK